MDTPLATRVAPPPADPHALLARLAATAEGDYLAYEGPDGLRLAEDPAVVLQGRRGGFEVTGDPDLAGSPGCRPGFDLAALDDLLGPAAAAGRRWFGWVAFEASCPDAATEEDVLVHAMLPRREIHVGAGGVSVTADSPEGLARATARLREAAAADLDVRDRGFVSTTGGEPGYARIVEQAVADLADPGLRKVILSRAVDVPFAVDLPATYLAGRRENTPARSFCLRSGTFEAAGFSPETVIEVDADREVRIMPLAGTRALTGDTATDARLRSELTTDPKEIYEHSVSVQAALHDLAGVADPRTCSVHGFLGVRERGSVQHLASLVRGVLRPGASPWQAFAAAFPAVTASGIPRRAALAEIHALEDRPRGLYSGSVFTQDPGGLDAALVLRSVYARDGRAWLRAGAGIVPQSSPEREFTETCEKLASVSGTLVRARSGSEQEEGRWSQLAS